MIIIKNLILTTATAITYVCCYSTFLSVGGIKLIKMVKANFNGVTFSDIGKGAEWSFPDYNCDRIPRKGDVMHFRHFVGNDGTWYYGVRESDN